jgi:hypothetical protein
MDALLHLPSARRRDAGVGRWMQRHIKRRPGPPVDEAALADMRGRP